MTREEMNLIRGFVGNIQSLKDAHINDNLPINYGMLCTIVAKGWGLLKELEDLEQESYEDTISRKEVLDEINRIGVEAFKDYSDYSNLYDFVDTLPCVQPKLIECEDAISRKDAIKAINKMDIPEDMSVFEIKSHIGVEIGTLPPVQPKSKTETITEFADRCRECGKQKKGRWIKITPSGIYMCSECEQNVLTGDIDAYHYCHHCGVKMINEDENHENQNES